MYVAQQLGRYHLLDRVAFGGMAEIYRAKTFDSQGNQHFVAIKRVLGHLADDDDFLQMLVDEAKIVTILDHANIARVYELARWGDEYFIAMEFVDGKDLRSLIDRCTDGGIWIPVEDCAYVMIRVLDALDAAHTKCDATGRPLNIIHRDVSPSNVIVSYDGQVKLCDFGIAKATLTRVQTRTGVIKGKVRYMSPEQALGRNLDHRTDIFSAGSVFYELLTRQPPFQADSEMELIFRVRDAKLTPPTRHNPSIPTPVERTLRRALAKSRSSRFQSAAEFADDLRGYLHDCHPDYRPGRLGRFLRKLFAKEIEKELRLLEEFVVGDANPETLGENLLAEVLGEGAAYTQFSPVDPSQMEEQKTRLLPRVPAPESRLPPSVDLHDLKTAIIDPEERDKRIIKRKGRARPGANHARDSRRPTQVGTLKLDAAPVLHAAPTQILRRVQPALAVSPTEDQREAAGVIGDSRPPEARGACALVESEREPPTHFAPDATPRPRQSRPDTNTAADAGGPLRPTDSQAGTFVASDRAPMAQVATERGDRGEPGAPVRDTVEDQQADPDTDPPTIVRHFSTDAGDSAELPMVADEDLVEISSEDADSLTAVDFVAAETDLGPLQQLQTREDPDRARRGTDEPADTEEILRRRRS